MITALYTDGGVIKQNPSPIGGTWAYALVDEHGQRIVERSGVITPAEAHVPLVTNNVPRWLIERLQEIQKTGRLKHVNYVLLDGHPTKAQLLAGVGKRGAPVSEHNVFCDRACQEAGQRFLASL